MSWIVHDRRDIGIVTITPANDLFYHDQDSAECACTPKLKECNGYTLVIHQSLDRREVFEQRELFRQGVLTDMNVDCLSCGKPIKLCECLDSNGNSVWKKEEKCE